jgi:hypothetical protein
MEAPHSFMLGSESLQTLSLTMGRISCTKHTLEQVMTQKAHAFSRRAIIALCPFDFATVRAL